MRRRLWLLRHGHRWDFANPEWFETAPRRYDPPLSPLGLAQAQSLADDFGDRQIDYLFCSPFLRAIQTALPIGDRLGLPLQIEAGLGEWHHGDWMSEAPETEPWESLLRQYPAINPHHTSVIHPVYPESEPEMRARIARCLSYLLTEFPGNLLVVGHSATVVAGLKHLLPNPAPNETIPVASARGLTFDGFSWLQISG